MHCSPHLRLALAIVVSAGFHALALIPLKALQASSDGARATRPNLSARLQWQAPSVTDHAREVVAEPAVPTAIDTAAHTKTATSELSTAERPASWSKHVESETSARQAINPMPGPPSPSLENPGQSLAGVRIALPNEVQVRVRLFEKGAEDNPLETMQVESSSYVYFNAPQLKASAKPLSDAKPHYPATQLSYPHGAVSLLLLIDEQGQLEKARVLCANPAFEASALASIRDMRFGAARDASGPVKSYMLVDFGYGVGAPCGPLPHNLLLNQRPG